MANKKTDETKTFTYYQSGARIQSTVQITIYRGCIFKFIGEQICKDLNKRKFKNESGTLIRLTAHYIL